MSAANWGIFWGAGGATQFFFGAEMSTKKHTPPCSSEELLLVDVSDIFYFFLFGVGGKGGGV